MTFGLWEWERKLLGPFPNFGKGNEKFYLNFLGTGMKTSIPDFREQSIVIPENDWERE